MLGIAQFMGLFVTRHYKLLGRFNVSIRQLFRKTLASVLPITTPAFHASEYCGYQ
jgi:hypothetical protein